LRGLERGGEGGKGELFYHQKVVHEKGKRKEGEGTKKSPPFRRQAHGKDLSGNSLNRAAFFPKQVRDRTKPPSASKGESRLWGSIPRNC